MQYVQSSVTFLHASAYERKGPALGMMGSKNGVQHLIGS